MKDRGKKPLKGLSLRFEEKKDRERFGGNGFARTALLFLLLMLFALPAMAQGVFTLAHGEWEASIFGGGSFLGSGVYETPTPGLATGSRAVGLKYGSGYQLGTRLTDNRWDRWSVSLEYGFTNQPITFTNLSDATPSLGLSHSIHRFSYDVGYYFRDKNSRWRPYAFGGPGVSLFYIKGSAKDAAAAQGFHFSDPWKFTMSWGGGIKYLLQRQVAASFQFSDSISGVPGYGLPETGAVVSGTYVPGFRPDGLMHNWLISLAFIYQWDDR